MVGRYPAEHFIGEMVCSGRILHQSILFGVFGGCMDKAGIGCFIESFSIKHPVSSTSKL